MLYIYFKVIDRKRTGNSRPFPIYNITFNHSFFAFKLVLAK